MDEALFLERFQLVVFEVIVQFLRLLFQNGILGEFSSLLGYVFRQIYPVGVSLFFGEKRPVLLQEHIRFKPLLRNVVFAATAKFLRRLGLQLLLIIV